MNKITHSFLRKEGACGWQRKLFRELYPKGIPVCWKCFQEAQSKGLEVYWLDRVTDQPLLIASLRSHCRRFPHLNDRDPSGTWDIPVLSVKGLKLLEQGLLERTET
jgi:hypothetical protein